MNSSGVANCLRKSASARCIFAAGTVIFRPQRFLIHQLFEDDHLQRAVANLLFKLFGDPVMLARIRKNRVFLAHQVGIGQDYARSHAQRACLQPAPVSQYFAWELA